MIIKILAFGIAREIFGSSYIELEMPEVISAGELKTEISSRYPALQKLRSFLLAVNNRYVADSQQIYYSDEIAVIPPVSGG